VNYPKHFIGHQDGTIKILDNGGHDFEENIVWKLKKSKVRKCLKEKHEAGLVDEQNIWSSCQTFEARMQGDGNFVLYKHLEGETPAIWASNTHGKGTGPYVLKMQGDGNLVVYDSTNAPTWASNTNGQG